MIEHCSADPTTPRLLGGVHRFQLRVLAVQPLQRTYCDELAV
jgi:hypothetical protein